MKYIISITRRLGSTLIFPIAWTLLTVGLLCLPGDALPDLGHFGLKSLDKGVDKVAHIGLFGGFVLFWGLYAWRRRRSASQWLIVLAGITILGILIGVSMEYVQLYFIPNRNFDVRDIIADAVGSVLAMFVLVKLGRSLNLTPD